ncbi:MAG TPA: HlyD family type I secretion periplasmic adaptor subunit, partial [Syntrophales bacterium]|nr:HlyD family type I secretion periplasmic adaptor subunit [Syntrophales bacterium]HRT27771.1 HlyD family type I secretion periplasmic adaptor subunit [Syntrophales bacterium]
MAAQEEFFRARRAKFETDRKIVMESLTGFRHYSAQLNQQKVSYEKQLMIIRQQLDSLKGLAEEGYYAKNRFLDLERAAEDLRGRIAETSANQLRAEATVQEYMMRLSAIERDYLKDVKAELADVEKKLPGIRDAYYAIKDMLEKTEIKAPDDGIVMGLRVHTIGGVVSPGQPILEIVPKDSELIVEAKLSPANVEDIRKGQTADLHFTALDPKKTPVFEGTVIYVSPDVMTDEVTKQPYYLVRVKINEETLKKIKELNKEISAGMPVQVVIKTGSRTFLSFLFKPFIDRLAISFLR